MVLNLSDHILSGSHSPGMFIPNSGERRIVLVVEKRPRIVPFWYLVYKMHLIVRIIGMTRKTEKKEEKKNKLNRQIFQTLQKCLMRSYRTQSIDIIAIIYKRKDVASNRTANIIVCY